MTGLVTGVAIACVLVGATAGAFIAGRRAQSRRRIPFDAVAELVDALARGLAGEDASRAVGRARTALGVPALELVDTADGAVHRSGAVAEIRMERAVVGALVAEGADRARQHVPFTAWLDSFSSRLSRRSSGPHASRRHRPNWLR